MPIDPKKLAVDYYFGDLQHWKLPNIAADALEQGYDGPALRKLASLANLGSHELRAEDIGATDTDAAFREMGVNAPITKDNARLALAIESAHKALNGKSNVFDEATHVRIHLCEISDSPDALNRIAILSKKSLHLPRSEWDRIEASLKEAFSEFLASPKAQVSE
jgi:hypothetical protein